MSINQWLVIAVLAVCLALVSSVIVIMLDVLDFRVPIAQAAPTETATPSPQPSFTRRPSPTLTPTARPSPTIERVILPSATSAKPASASGKTTATLKSKFSPTPTRTASRTATLPPMLPSVTVTPARVNADIRFISVSVARPGENAQVAVQTVANVPCSLLYISTAGNFVNIPGANQKSDTSGKAIWVWKISEDTRPGQGIVIVTCGNTSSESQITIER